jgi:hypothetical protein
VPALIARLLINFYIDNFVRVQWCGIVSDYFSAGNGVKLGGVLSLVLLCIYIDGLLVALSRAGVGCFVGSNKEKKIKTGKVNFFYTEPPSGCPRKHD